MMEKIAAYTKGTRPLIARQSAWATYLYVVACIGGQLVQAFTGQPVTVPAPDMLVIGAIYSPALTYNVARTVDKVNGAQPENTPQ